MNATPAMNAERNAAHVCLVCGLIYDPALGLPEYGIPPGIPWDDLPPDWLCPDCLAGKEDFAVME